MSIGDNTVTSPIHYSKDKIEVLEFCRVNEIDFCRGNVIKYIIRHKEKKGLEDLKKAYVYFLQYICHEYGLSGVEEVLNTKWNISNVEYNP